MNINAKLFKDMLESGANNLSNNYHRIDELNVFPVPDGDTGTNMSLTFKSGVKDALNYLSDDLSDIAKALSKGLLMGARGNSGVILSQIFRGIYQGVDGKKEVNGLELAQAFVKGSEVAYKAVMRPVEGTILTVIRESSAYTLTFAESKENVTCKEVIEKIVEEAHISLKGTPELLPVLKEVGVVDSGGAGLVTIFEGFKSAINGTIIECCEPTENSVNTIGANIESDEFGYCTEFIIRLNDNNVDSFNEEMLKTPLSKIGDSLVVVQDDDIVKVHVHTLTPGEALNISQKYGEFVKLKIENMQEQHESLITNDNTNVQPVAKEIEKKKYALIAVAAGDGLKTMFEDLRVDYVISGGQTMNPSTEDFVAAINSLNAEHIIILPNNSNIILAAQQCKNVLDDLDIHVIESKSIPQGLLSCIMFNPELDCDTNISEMKDALTNVKTGQVTYAIKDTTFEGLEIHEGDFMGLLEKDIVVSTTVMLDTTKQLIDQLISEESEICTVIAGEDASEEEVEEVVNYIENKYSVEVEVNRGNQPVYTFILGVE